MKLGPRDISFFALLSKPICLCYWSVLFTFKIRGSKFYGFMHCFTYGSNLSKCSKDVTRNPTHLEITLVYRIQLSITLTTLSCNNLQHQDSFSRLRHWVLLQEEHSYINMKKTVAKKIFFLPRDACVFLLLF